MAKIKTEDIYSHRMKKGDIVYLEYEGRIKDTNKLFDTTHEAKAKKEEIYDEKREYRALPIIVGEKTPLKGLEKSLSKADVGKEYKVDVKPRDAYGDREAKKVEIFSIREFRRKEIKPEVGLDVNIGKRIGRITAVTAGRVMVDFNHPLAGKTLSYKYKIVKKLAAKKEKIRAIIDLHYGKGDFKIQVKESEATISLPKSCRYDQRWFLSKYRVVNDIKKFVGIKKIKFVEEYIEEKKSKKKK